MNDATTPAVVEELLIAARELAHMGLSPGSSGNVSIRHRSDVWLSASGSSLGTLTPEHLAQVSWPAGQPDIAGPKPTKEVDLHLAMYHRDPSYRCVIHLHSPHAVAVSCLNPWASHTALAPLSPYVIMRVGNVPLIPYAPPGDAEQATLVRSSRRRFHAVLLQNHGHLVAGRTVQETLERAIEVEEAARVQLQVGYHPERRELSDEQTAELARTYGQPWGD